MKKSFLAKSAMIFILPLFFLSCTGDGSMEAEPDEASKVEKLQKDIIGRWLFNGENLRTVAGENLSFQ